MEQERDIWVVPIPLAIIKRMEKIFIANDVPYWTDGNLAAAVAKYRMRKEKGTTKKLVHLADLWGHIKEHNLKSAIKTELSDVLQTVDLQVWLQNNKKRRSTVIENTET